MRLPSLRAVLPALAMLLPAPAASGDAPPLAAAAAECRRVVVAEIPEGERQAREERVGKAISALHAGGEEGAEAVEAELARMRAAGEADVFFQSIAAEVILDARRADGVAAALAAIRGIAPDRDLPYLWSVLTWAAASRDPRALPLLRVALATDEKSKPAVFPQHAMRVPWPHSLDFLYGAFGPGACDDLAAAISGPPDPRVDASAAWQLASLRCPGAEAVLRAWAAGKEPARTGAGLRALGVLGHPADREPLSACAGRPEPEIRRFCAYGLWELSDPATTPAVRRLLGDADEEVRVEAVSAAFHLADPETMAAVMARRPAARGREAETIDGLLAELAKSSGVPVEALTRSDPAAWKKAIDGYWAERARLFELRDGDPRLTREEWEKALQRWEERGTVDRADRAHMRAALAVARAGDLPALYRARGRVLLRQSDECLPEVQWLERIIRVVHRRSIGSARPNE